MKCKHTGRVLKSPLDLTEYDMETAKYEPKEGETVSFRHERFGKGTATVHFVDETWVDLQMKKGVLRGHGRGAIWGPGETKRALRSHIYWYPQNALGQRRATREKTNE